MSAIAEARFLTRKLAEPRPAGDSVKAAISRVYGQLLLAAKHMREVDRIDVGDISHNRIKDFWQGARRARPRKDELTVLETATKSARQQQELERVGRDEILQLRARIARIESIVCTAYPNADRGELAEIGRGLVGVRGVPGTLDSPLAPSGERS